MDLKNTLIILIIVASIIYTSFTYNASPLVLAIFVLPFLFLQREGIKKYLGQVVGLVLILLLFNYFYSGKSLKQSLLISAVTAAIILGLYYFAVHGLSLFIEHTKNLIAGIFEDNKND